MKYRKLRIAWSVGCGVLCLLLMVLWLRSQRWQDRVMRHAPVVFEFQSYHNLTFTAVYRNPFLTTTTHWEFDSRLSSHEWWAKHSKQLGMEWGAYNGGYYLFLPHWFVALLTASFAAFPWIPWRFSLRTLLIGMTVAAIGLGWIVYTLRNQPPSALKRPAPPTIRPAGGSLK